MRWEKLGRIFDPADWDLGEGIVGYAQGPQALVFDDFVRIYFSTRKVSGNGKYVSTVRFVDFDRRLTQVLRVERDDVIQPGGLGCFDEHGIFPFNVLRVGDDVFGYTCGWSRRKSVDIDMAIGLARSHDGGERFVRMGPGPVLGASLNEPFLIGDPFVRLLGDVFHMWYIFGTGWKAYAGFDHPDRIYKIGHATSADGRDWRRNDGRQLVADAVGAEECQAMPSVSRIGDRHHLFFCFRYASDFRRNSARAYRMGHAVSDDLSNWTRSADDLCIQPSPEQWDGEMICYPHVFTVDEQVYLLYNGNEFGRHGFGLAKLCGD